MVAGCGLLASACSGSPAAPRPTAATPAPSTTAMPAGVSLVATLHGRAVRYASPGGATDGSLPAKWHGAKSALPVIESRPGWVEVRVAQRPNGSTAWVRAADVTMSSTPYRIIINTTTMHLTLYKDARQILSAPAGIGTTSDPTPAGDYFVAFLEAPPRPNPGYGAFILVTSAHSDSIAD